MLSQRKEDFCEITFYFHLLLCMLILIFSFSVLYTNVLCICVAEYVFSSRLCKVVDLHPLSVKDILFH